MRFIPCSLPTGATFASPVKAGHPFEAKDGDRSFAPDGSFIVVSAQRPRRFGEYDKEGWEGTTDGEVYWVDVRALDKYRSANR
jgi:hypothetical protein